MCPKEAKVASSADEGERQGLEMSSQSMDVSTPVTRDKLKRRRYAAARAILRLLFLSVIESISNCLRFWTFGTSALWQGR